MLEKIDTQDIIAVAKQAGEAIMSIYRRDFAVEYKGDSSPLTEADKAAHLIIEAGLQRLNEKVGIHIPILSEEGKDIAYETRKDWGYFWLVDPLDGTKEFIKKNDEFTVNIALVHEGIPVAGVVYAPALNTTYWAKKGQGAYKDGERLPLMQSRETFRVVASRSHMSPETQAFIDALPVAQTRELISVGSSLKICWVAEGQADVYPRLGPTMEWDTAAAHAIVLEAGKDLKGVSPQGQFFAHLYNKPSLLNAWFVVGSNL